MTYTLEQFAAECRDALAADSGRAGREGVLACVKKALASPEFLETHLGPDATAEREIGSARFVASARAAGAGEGEAGGGA